MYMTQKTKTDELNLNSHEEESKKMKTDHKELTQENETKKISRRGRPRKNPFKTVVKQINLKDEIPPSPENKEELPSNDALLYSHEEEKKRLGKEEKKDAKKEKNLKEKSHISKNNTTKKLNSKEQEHTEVFPLNNNEETKKKRIKKKKNETLSLFADKEETKLKLNEQATQLNLLESMYENSKDTVEDVLENIHEEIEARKSLTTQKENKMNTNIKHRLYEEYLPDIKIKQLNEKDLDELMPFVSHDKKQEISLYKNKEKNLKTQQKSEIHSEDGEQTHKQKGLSKNIFQRIPVELNTIKDKESMYNPQLSPAPKQLQGQDLKEDIQKKQIIDEDNSLFEKSLHSTLGFSDPSQHFLHGENQAKNYKQEAHDYQTYIPNKNNTRRNNIQKNQNISEHSPEHSFDNSSIIAAITGKNLDITAKSECNHLEKNKQQHATKKYGKNSSHANESLNEVPPTQQKIKKPLQERIYKNTLIPQQNIYDEQTSFEPQLYDERHVYSKENTGYHNEEIPSQHLPYFIEDSLERSENLYNEEYSPVVPAFEQKKTRGRKKKVENDIDFDDSLNQNKNLKMYVSVQSEEQIEVALVKNGLVVEYFVEMTHQAKIRGNIYKATVHNVDPNLQAAFINFGSAKNGFLQIDEVHPDYYLTPHLSTKNHKFPLISKVLKPGQELYVQIVKEPTLSKGAFLTTWIALAGRFLVLTPGQEQLGVSRKVTDPEERGRLRAMLDHINPDKGMGIIIRTAAANASLEELQADLDYLQKLWFDILTRSADKPAPLLVHQEIELTQRVVRDYLDEDVREIWTNDKQMAGSIAEMANLLYPHKNNMVRLYANQRINLWERFNLQKQIDEILQREIHLPSGGRVVFDQTEALMAIDINSAKTQSKGNFQEMVYQTNLEAAQAIARHLRLRDIGGQIVIDFIELRDKSTIKEIEKAFKLAMRSDRARYEIGHISPFGLLEVIRQRIGSSAISISTEPCPHCNGTGSRRNMEWQAQDALKEIARKARQEKSIKYVHHVNTELALYLLNHKRERINELESQFNVRIEITSTICP